MRLGACGRETSRCMTHRATKQFRAARAATRARTRWRRKASGYVLVLSLACVNETARSSRLSLLRRDIRNCVWFSGLRAGVS